MLGLPDTPSLFEILELISCIFDFSYYFTFLIRMSGLDTRYGELTSDSLSRCPFLFVIDSPLIIFGDAIFLTGDEDRKSSICLLR